MSTATRRARGHAALEATHPLNTREKRTAVNYALRGKGIPAKACSVCWVIKSTAEFNRKSSASDGLTPDCRSCHAATHAQRQAVDPEYREKRRVASLAYNATHVETRRAYQKQHKAKIHAEYKTRNAHRVQDPNVLKRCAGQCQRLLPETSFRLDRRNPDGLRIKCRDCADASRRSRRACLLAYGEPVGHDCYLCGDLIDDSEDVQVDHLVPQSSGGRDSAENVRWTHGRCNRHRFNKPLTAEQLRRAAASGPLPELPFSFTGE
jgi:hypothetical protein